jgi:hypothetical protein
VEIPGIFIPVHCTNLILPVLDLQKTLQVRHPLGILLLMISKKPNSTLDKTKTKSNGTNNGEYDFNG